MKFLDLGQVIGLSAYQLAVKQGYKGSLDEWLASLKYDHSEEYQGFKRAIEAEVSKFTSQKAELDSKMESIRQLVTQALQEIANKKADYINELTSNKNGALSDISSSKEAAQAKIEEAVTNAIKAMNANGDAWESRVRSVGELTKEEVQNAADVTLSAFKKDAEDKTTEELKKINTDAIVQQVTNQSNKIDELQEQFEKPIQKQVDDYLNRHPEATTTVQDGSLTLTKFKNGEIPFVTPEQFGAIGDGVADDTNAIKEALTHNYVLGSGIYAISEPIKFQLKGDIDISINLKAIKDMEYMLWIDAADSKWLSLLRGKLKVDADCNKLAKNGIRYDRCHGLTMELMVMDCAKVGVYAHYTKNLTCGGNRVSASIFNFNLEPSKETIGLIAGQDEIHPLVNPVNTYVAIELNYGGNVFDIVHPWSSTLGWVTIGSKCLDIKTNSENFIKTLISDTMDVVFKFNSGFKYPIITVSDMQIYSNSSVFPEALSYLVEVSEKSTDTLGYIVKDIRDVIMSRPSGIRFINGFMPLLKYSDDNLAEETKSYKDSLLFAFVKVSNNGKKVTPSELKYYINCKDCYFRIDEWNQTILLNSDRICSSDMFLQKASGIRGALEREIDKSFNPTPWNDKGFAFKRATREITIDTSKSIIIDLSTVPGIPSKVIQYATVTVINAIGNYGCRIVGSTVYFMYDDDFANAYNGQKKTVIIKAMFVVPN